MAGKKPPRPAMVEDYDEEFDDIVPESRQVANTAAKVVTRSDHRFPEPLIDGASDSGYSSRTAATANSTQSAPSGGKSPPVPHKLHMPKQRADFDRHPSTRREHRERRDHQDRQDRPRPGHEESMRVGAYPGSAQYHSHVPRSPSKSRSRRDSSARHYQDAAHYYEGGPVYHQQQPPTPIDRYPPNMEYPPAMYGRPPMPDMVPSSPRYAPPPRHAYGYEEYHRPTSRTNRSHSYRPSGGYNQDSRPMSMSIHEMSSMGPPRNVPYDSYGAGGPPPSNSAYYASSPYGAGSFTGYAGSEFPAMEYGPERSPSRTREPSRRRNSLYDPRMMEPDDVFAQEFEEFDQLERYSSREPRGRYSSKPPQPRDEDYYREYSRMPPPPVPKSRAAPKIIQNKRPEGPRKSQTVQTVPSAPQRRMSRATADHAAEFMDMSEMRNALPDSAHRRLSRETGMAPERTQSMRESRRSNSYHDTGRGTRIAVENSRRRRPGRAEQYYDVDNDSQEDELEEQLSTVEQYQNAKAGRSTTAALPASSESLIPKMANGAGSENGSRKSGSHSSRESATGSKTGGGKDISLMMDGIQLGFKEEAVHGKMINIRSDDSGGFHLSLGGNANRKPKAYLPAGSSYSDKTNTASRRELVEDVRRTRDDRRLERASTRRSSQSTYGRRY
ncbi:hypothetical protein N7533_008119 [Penicillium manginii]|uniref:uncharacterized protein n=1 Tax=Penicillium manginii TaxID=203109 RepID=UPI0025479042|nr:uncharacterized protein N7533_008119 [Penicillium manginii]KAJ5751091.1 hypothetical protein N7533_008119 [Penicillium manginii]